jgi:5'-deoxynucleotidase YfbR-like HD superfamily hydrolase/ferredoxin
MDTHWKPTIVDRLNLADVDRWHLLKTKRPQNLSEHTYGVLCIALELYDSTKHPLKDKRLSMERITRYVLDHDADEIIIGDIPSPTKPRIGVKWEHPILIKNNTNISEKYIVKLADMIEAVQYFWQNADGYRSKKEYKILLDKTLNFIYERLEDKGGVVSRETMGDKQEISLVNTISYEALILIHKLIQPKIEDYSTPSSLSQSDIFSVLVLGLPSTKNGNSMCTGKYIPCHRDTTVLVAMEKNNAFIDHNCRNGHCGVCKLKVLYGNFSYGDENPMSHEDGSILSCRAIPISNCVLEVINE